MGKDKGLQSHLSSITPKWYKKGEKQVTEQLRRMGQLIGMAVSAFRVADLKLRSSRMTSAAAKKVFTANMAGVQVLCIVG